MLRVDPPDHSRNFAILTPAGSEKTWQDARTAEIFDAYRKYGAVLLRGFADTEYESFAKISDRFCRGYLSNVSAGRGKIEGDRSTQTVNLGNDPFPLHPEMAHKPWKPEICWFWCLSPPSEGGETT